MSSKEFNMIRSKIRNAFLFSSLKRQALQNFKVSVGLYQCSCCKAVNALKDVHVDHTVPVVDPKVGFVDWNTYVSRLYCDVSSLTVLCKACHKTKTNSENAQRKLHKTGIWSDASRKLRSETHKGKKKSKEAKESMSLSRKGVKASPRKLEQIRNTAKLRCKPVRAIKLEDGTVQEFQSTMAAGEALNIYYGNITRVCNNAQGRRQAGGYRFEYITKS